VAEYNLRQTDKWGETSLGLSFFYAPGSITRYNDDAAFLTARSGGTANYSYLRGTFSRLLDLGTFTKHLDDFKLLVRGTGQWSNANLVASEQIGLGGQDSVRGYPERTMRGDHGIFIQTELYSPAFHPLRWLAKKVPDRWVDAADRTDELRFLIFYDYGWADVHQATAAEPGEILNASSLGIGLRYRINKSMTFRFDYGFQLERLDPRVVNSFDLSPKYSHHGDGYAHMGLSISF
jgi:hemolysin activation/secretion protein